MDRITVEKIANKIEKLQGKNDWYSCLCDVFELSAITLSNQFDHREPYWSNRENRYKDLIKKYLAIYISYLVKWQNPMEFLMII